MPEEAVHSRPAGFGARRVLRELTSQQWPGRRVAGGRGEAWTGRESSCMQDRCVSL